jgi:hypothetical protein
MNDPFVCLLELPRGEAKNLKNVKRIPGYGKISDDCGGDSVGSAKDVHATGPGKKLKLHDKKT